MRSIIFLNTCDEPNASVKIVAWPVAPAAWASNSLRITAMPYRNIRWVCMSISPGRHQGLACAINDCGVFTGLKIFVYLADQIAFYQHILLEGKLFILTVKDVYVCKEYV